MSRSTPRAVSRRTITTGMAWAVPAVSLASVTPVFAASRVVAQCYPLVWTATASTTATPQTFTSTGTQGAVGTITATPAVSSATYSIPPTDNYAPYNMSSSTAGTVTLSTRVSTTASVADRTSNYQSLTIQYPPGPRAR